MPASRYRRHDPAGRAKYQDVKQHARTQARVLAGTPGVLKSRTIAGKQYWMREYIRVDGKKTDEYLGAAGTVGRERVEKLRGEIELAGALAAGSAQLRLFGYQRIDRKPAAVLAVLYNRRLFHAGLTLVGSHAYGALLNELGILAAGYKTQDVDLARGAALSVALRESATFQSLLKETTLAFVPVPRLRAQEVSTSYKLAGSQALAVHLLAPGKSAGEIVPLKELAAHAQAMPFLDFLIEETIDSVVLSPNQVIPVRIPAPERFAVHKLFSSQSRRSDRDKVRKDLEQAALLASAIEEETPERLGEAYKALRAPAKAAVRRGAGAAARLLEGSHAEGREALLRIAGRRRVGGH
jgi:hypothetical protein